MSLILVVEPDTNCAERIAAALRPDGWDVVLSHNREAALRSIATQAPDLLIASGSLPGAKDLLRSFARHGGGPGAMVLVPATLAGHISARDFAADQVITKPLSETGLAQQVGIFLHSRTTSLEAADDGERLTSADIFGDLLAEVEAEGAARRELEEMPEADFEAEIDRKLEQTFSGFLDTTPSTAPAAAPSPQPASSTTAGPDDDFDQLLEQTLSALEVPAPAAPPAATQLIAKTQLEQAPNESPQNAPLTRADDGSLRFGDYRLLQKIATGGMAEVWKARRSGVEGFQKTVAIKKILSHLTSSQDFVSMFIDEAKLAAQLSHNHIIQIYDLGKVEQDYFIAMEYVEGTDLRSLLRRASDSGQRMPPGLALLIGMRLAQALDHAHRQRDFEDRPLGLVHRDVSPQNVLISWDGDIKLCDFGIVKAVVKASTTQMGALKGKLQYMSPEQASGQPVDARSDLFSLGSVLFEMLTGHKLFTADSEMAVLDAVRACRHPAPRELAPELAVEIEQVVVRALAKDPGRRHGSAGELAAELEATLNNLRLATGQGELARYVTGLFGQDSDALRSSAAAAPEPAVVASFGKAPAGEDSAAGHENVAEVVFEPAPELPPVPQTPVRVDLDQPPTVAETTVAATAAAEATPSRPPRRPLGWWIVALLALAAAVAAFAWWRSQPSRQASPAAVVNEQDQTPQTAPQPLPPVTQDSADRPASAADSAVETAPPATTATDRQNELPAVGEEPLAVEEQVDEELRRRAAELQRSFESERRRLEQELEAARQDGTSANDEAPADRVQSDAGGG